MKNKIGSMIVTAIVLGLVGVSPSIAQDMTRGADNFYQSEDVTARKVTFENQYGLKVTGNRGRL